MPTIHYFQRYSSVENTVTNNTLQLLARVYASSPTKASLLLSELTGEAIETGIEMRQQERGEGSVPDAAVVQPSFKILLESKIDAPTDTDQLLAHAASFSSEDQKILLLLTKTPIGEAEADIAKEISKTHTNVVFRNITYEDVCNAIDGLFKEHEYDMRSLIDDYIEYCNDTGLFDQSRYLMRIVPCGQSLELNRKYGIYFHPSDRAYTRHQFVGVYKEKAVQALWQIDSVFDIESSGGNLEKTLIQGRDTDDYDEKIRAIIEDAWEECGYEIASGHRFFCGEPLDTYYKKSSSGGIQGTRFVNLRHELGEFEGPAEAADKLKRFEWS